MPPPRRWVLLLSCKVAEESKGAAGLPPYGGSARSAPGTTGSRQCPDQAPPV
jgi:hypothetical protein